jgi:hypothetical protein
MLRSLLIATALTVLAGCSGSTGSCPLRETDEPLINHALDLYGKGKATRDELRRSFDLAVVYLPNMTCVGFNLKAGSAGGDETMCFDKKGQKVLTYRNGD